MSCIGYIVVLLCCYMETKEFNRHLKNAHSNKKVFTKLYDEYYSKIVLHISVKFENSIAQDIAQSFFYRVISGDFKDVDYINYPIGWIYKVCDNIAINIYRKEAKYVSLSEFEFGYYKDDIDDILDIKQLLNDLDDFERKIIYLHFFEGYSLKEIAYNIGIKYDNFRKKYSAILKKLSKKVKYLFKEE